MEYLPSPSLTPASSSSEADDESPKKRKQLPPSPEGSHARLRRVIEATFLLTAFGACSFAKSVELTTYRYHYFLWAALTIAALLLWKRRPLTTKLYAVLLPVLITTAKLPSAAALNLQFAMALSLMSCIDSGLDVVYPICLLIAPSFPLLAPVYKSFFGTVESIARTSLSPSETSLVSMALSTMLFDSSHDNDIHAIRKGILLGSMLAAASASDVLLSYIRLERTPRIKRSNRHDYNARKLYISFYLRFFVALLPIYPWLSLRLHRDPVIWAIDYILLSQAALRRCALSVYWAACLILCAIAIATMNKSKADPTSLDRRRKFFHALVVVMFLPTLQLDPSFASLALSIALTLFLQMELLRISTIPPLGRPLHRFLRPFTDSRDLQGPVIVSHIFLLLGISLPLWLEDQLSWRICTGVVCLGCGDAAASIVGKIFGRHCWLGSRKTVEGTLAFIAAVCMGAYGAAVFGGDLVPLQGHWLSLLVIAVVAGGLEAFSGMNDNVVVPVFTWCLFKVFT